MAMSIAASSTITTTSTTNSVTSAGTGLPINIPIDAAVGVGCVSSNASLLLSGSLPSSFAAQNFASINAPDSSTASSSLAEPNSSSSSAQLLSLAELLKLQQQQQQQTTALLAEEQQRLLQAHVRAFLERKQQQQQQHVTNDNNNGSAGNPGNNPTSSSGDYKSDQQIRIRSTTNSGTRARSDFGGSSANASSEVKQRLQEFVLQKRQREAAAGRYSTSHWASSQQASTEHGSSPSSSTAGTTGDLSPPTTNVLPVRLQGAALLMDESHQLRKTASEPNLKVRTLIKQRVMERRQSPLVKRSSKLNMRRRSPLAAGMSPTRSNSDSGPNSPAAITANNRSGSSSSLNNTADSTCSVNNVNNINSNNAALFRFLPPQTSSSLVSSSTSAFVESLVCKQQQHELPQQHNPCNIMQQPIDLNALSSFTCGHPSNTLFPNNGGETQNQQLSSSSNTFVEGARRDLAATTLLDQITRVQQHQLACRSPAAPHQQQLPPTPTFMPINSAAGFSNISDAEHQQRAMLIATQLAMENASALSTESPSHEQQNVFRLLQAVVAQQHQQEQHQAIQVLASLLASQQLQQQAALSAAANSSTTLTIDEQMRALEQQYAGPTSSFATESAAEPSAYVEGSDVDESLDTASIAGVKKLNRTFPGSLTTSDAFALQQNLAQIQNDPVRLKQFIEQQQHAYAKHQLRQAVLQRANSKNNTSKQATIEEGQEDSTFSGEQQNIDAASTVIFATSKSSGNGMLTPAEVLAYMGIHTTPPSADSSSADEAAQNTFPLRSGSFGSGRLKSLSGVSASGAGAAVSSTSPLKKQRSLSSEDSAASSVESATVIASPSSSRNSSSHHPHHHGHHHHHHGHYQSSVQRSSPKVGKKTSAPTSSSPPKLAKLSAALSQQIGRPLARALSSPLVLNSFTSSHPGLAMSAAAATAAQYQMQLQAMKHGGGITGGRASTGLAFDPVMLEHGCVCGDKDGATHPEHAGRLSSIWTRLEEHGYTGLCERIASRKATLEELQLCHSEAYALLLGSNPINRQKLDLSRLSHLPMKSFCLLPCGGIGVDADTPWNELTTASAARTAVGLSIDLALRVAIGELKNGFALVRPPGHHAERELAMGFCFFNTVAIVARVLKERLHLFRILIIDIDLHHCNGTQNILYDDAEVLVISLHRYDDGNYFPGTGNITEVGGSGAQGFNINVAFGGKLDPPMTDVEYLAAFRTIVLPIAQQFNPDIVLVSAGFAASIGHEAPMGGYRVTPNCFAHLTRALMSLANGKVALILEGGFNLHAISDCSEACLQALLGAPLEPLPESVLCAKPNRPCIETLIAVIAAHLPFWPTLARQATTLGMSIRQAEKHEREAASAIAALASLSVDTLSMQTNAAADRSQNDGSISAAATVQQTY